MAKQFNITPASNWQKWKALPASQKESFIAFRNIEVTADAAFLSNEKLVAPGVEIQKVPWHEQSSKQRKRGEAGTEWNTPFYALIHGGVSECHFSFPDSHCSLGRRRGRTKPDHVVSAEQS